MADPSYLTSAEFARRAVVRPETVARWANEGRIPCIRTAGGHRRFRLDHVDSFLATLGHEPAAQPEPEPEPEEQA